MTNSINNLEGEKEKYVSGEIAHSFVHDEETIGILRNILIEAKKMNIHLQSLSGLDIKDYNIEDIE